MSTKLVLGAALLLPAAAFAADVNKEIATAAAHAQYAAQASDLMTVHMHLHHTMNCLSGPKGKGYDPTSENPCAGFGNGAIPDESDPARQQQLRAAFTTAHEGEESSSLTVARQDAASVVMQLHELK